MQLTQKQLDKGNTLLNQQATYINGEEISLFVHYWGGEVSLKTNLPHKHSFYEICYVVGGEGTYLEQGKEYRLRKGYLFLSRPHIKHQIKGNKKLNILFCAFEPTFSKATDKGVALFEELKNTDPILLKEQQSLEIFWTALLLQAQQQSSFIKDTIVNLSGALIFSMTQLYINEMKPTNSSSQSIKGQSTTMIYRAKLYIRDNFSQPLRLKEVSDYLHVSSRHLSRIFTDELGVTFTQYVRTERINRAATLLSTTDLPIKTIANKVGFETVHYFTTVFKEVIGVTPGEFSKKLTSE